MNLRTACVVSSALALVLAPFPTTASAQVAHTVEPGESLWSIAAQNGLSVHELAAANDLPPDAWLVAGATVVVPPIAAAGGSGECVWDCASSVHPHPTDETVTPALVGSIAAEYGMSAPLVESMAWNESAFSNAVVSSAGARGVMQIIPDTWTFVGEQLAEQPLDPASATDNVRAGVIYLHHLYHLMGGDGDATIAAYVQGPNTDGLLPEARAYVDEVRADEDDFRP